MRQKIFIFIIALFVLAGMASWYLYFKKYEQQDTVNIHNFPQQIGEWTSQELTITEEEYAILETRNAFTRRYTHPENGTQVDLLIVYSQNNRKVSHPPEICYTGSGATILRHDQAVLPVSETGGVTANRLVMDLNDREYLSYYWFKVGDSYTPNYWKQQILIALKTLTAKPASSALIRMSILVPNDDQQQTEEEVKNFTRVMFPLLATYLP